MSYVQYVTRVETFDYTTLYRIDNINSITIALASIEELKWVTFLNNQIGFFMCELTELCILNISCCNAILCKELFM